MQRKRFCNELKGRGIVYENDVKIIEKAQNGSKDDMTKLVEDNNGLVWSIVRRFNGRGYDIEDLYHNLSH